MVFSSVDFLFLFLPCILFGYYLLFYKSRTLQNIFLFVGSLLFYAWGEPKIVFIMLLSIAVNWALGLLAESYGGNKRKLKIIYLAAGMFNFGLLFIFKYLNFTYDGIKHLFSLKYEMGHIALPIGISFFSFQAFSYVIDIGRGQVKARKNPVYTGLYISFFPQLIAGPIVRYGDIADQLQNRKENFEDFSNGVLRFLRGLFKKVFLANTLALVADEAFGFGRPSLSFAWFGALAYALQIFYDFSAYSDMALGLGLMFGFKLPENFDYPYSAKSVSDFWRRWHMTLGTWFRDYVYIPLGGSRVSKKSRLVFNLFVVWFLTGLWHGADWTFILWGLFYFVLISFEKLTAFEKRTKNHTLIKRVYTLFLVLAAWVLFRAESPAAALEYYKAMFCPTEAFFDTAFFFNLKNYGAALVFGLYFAFPKKGKLTDKIESLHLYEGLRAGAYAILFLFALSYIVKGTYNPFIYFNF